MKTLDEFELVKGFLIGQGMKPTVAMVGMSSTAWIDLVIIAREWKSKLDAEEADEKARLEAMTDEEKDREKEKAEQAAELEKQKALFHSCGSKPERP